MDDEEVSYASIGEPLYRVEAGNIEYRYTMGSISLFEFEFEFFPKIVSKLIYFH